MDWESRCRRAEAAKKEVQTALVLCAAVAGWAIGGWLGLLVFAGFVAVGTAH